MSEAFSTVVRDRHSVRDFLPDPVPQSVLDEILDDARYAPSWSNTRPYCLAVASGERLERLRVAYLRAFDASLGLQHRKPRALMEGLLLRRGWPDADFRTWGRYPRTLRERSVKVGKALYAHLGIDRGDRPARDAQARRNCEFFGAPTVLWVFVHEDLLPFSAHDAGLMLQTLMLSAQAHGIGSCALGVLATWRHPIDAEFQIPKHYKLITGLALGHPSPDAVNDFRAEHPPIDQARARTE
ncbi:MAG: nitroreductase [Propionibacteriaceae bacterium]